MVRPDFREECFVVFLVSSLLRHCSSSFNVSVAEDDNATNSWDDAQIRDIRETILEMYGSGEEYGLAGQNS